MSFLFILADVDKMFAQSKSLQNNLTRKPGINSSLAHACNLSIGRLISRLLGETVSNKQKLTNALFPSKYPEV